MDALEAALRPIANLLNKNIRESTPARELCEQLDGSVVAVRVRDTALAAWFVISTESLALLTNSEAEADVAIEGSLISLLKMMRQSDASAIRDGSVDISGDAELAARFQALLQFAKPDIEEELSGVVGDVAAHRLGELARGVGRWGREARATMGANIREYLQEESRNAPSRYEVERFSADVGKLRDAVDRAEARLNRLQDMN